VNPLAETHDGKVVAADAKLGFDDNAAFRQKELFAMRDYSQEDPRHACLPRPRRRPPGWRRSLTVAPTALRARATAQHARAALRLPVYVVTIVPEAACARARVHW